MTAGSAERLVAGGGDALVLSLPASIRIFVARDAVEFRKAHDGLLAVIRDAFGDDPFDGSLFVFLNRSRDRVKLLQWDRDGFWLHYKRLEQGTFRIDVTSDGSRCEISRAQLAMVIGSLKAPSSWSPWDAGL